MKRIVYSFVIFLILGFTQMQSDKMVIYGSDSCNHCINLNKVLNSAKIEYTFCDAKSNKERKKEMIHILNKHRSDGYVTFPLVKINGKKLINEAALRTITKALKKE